MSVRVLFKEGNWEICQVAEPALRGTYFVIEHRGCKKQEAEWKAAAVVGGDGGGHCYYCKEGTPDFIFNMWGFMEWLPR